MQADHKQLRPSLSKARCVCQAHEHAVDDSCELQAGSGPAEGRAVRTWCEAAKRGLARQQLLELGQAFGLAEVSCACCSWW